MKGNRPLIILLIAILAINVFLLALPQITVKAQGGPIIVIDGNLEDWDAVPSDQLYNFTDAVGDTYQWSKNATIVSVGQSAEKPWLVTGNVTKNDMCRDLKALYFVSTYEKIYMRLDVAGLYPGWNNTSLHGTVTFANVSVYMFSFDYTSGGWINPLGILDELNYTDASWRPDFYFEWDGNYGYLGKYPNYGRVIDTSGGIEVKTNISKGVFEFSLDRASLEGGLGEGLGVVNVWLMSYKPGEGWGLYAPTALRRLFDPQAPGTPGEDYGSPPWPGMGPIGSPNSSWTGGVYWWQDWGPYNIGHNLTTSPTVAGLDGVHNVTGQPLTLTYPIPIDYADIIGPQDAFTYAPTSWKDTRATLKPIVKCEVDLTTWRGPKAAFTYTPKAPYPGETVTFNTSTSKSGYNQTVLPIVSYEWNFGDGTPIFETPTVSGVSPRFATHRYAASGLYNVTLMVICQSGVTPNMDSTWQLIYVTVVEPRNITANGDLSDWAGMSPLYSDLTGDLQDWCTDLTKLSQGSTPEDATLNAQNNKARDLKALYVTSNATHVFFRLDVVGFPYGSALWGDGHVILNSTSGKPLPGTHPTYYNASVYSIYIDTDFATWSGSEEMSWGIDTASPPGAFWDREIYWSNGTDIVIRASGWVDVDYVPGHRGLDGNVLSDGNLRAGVNLASGAFEIAVPREDFGENWDNESLRIWVTSHKPGEWGEKPGSYALNWTRSFDPQAPGTLGEIWSTWPGVAANGSDVADVMPGDSGLIELVPGDRRGRVRGYLTVPTYKPTRDTAVLSVAPLGLPAYSTVPGCDATFAKWHPTWKYEFYIEVLVKNRGTVTASNVEVKLYNGTSLIGTKTITLGPHADENVQFKWVPVQNLTYPTRMKGYPWPYPTRTDIKANVTVVSGDVNPSNNQLVWGTLTIRYPGDAGKAVLTAGQWVYTPGDGKVYIEDLGLFGKWGWGADRTKTGKTKTKYEAFGFWCDFSVDGKVSVEDLAVLGRTWGAKPKGAGIY